MESLDYCCSIGRRAVHLPGGNRLDDVRLDLPRSYAEQEDWLRTVPKRSVKKMRLRTLARRIVHRAEPYRLREALVTTGLRRGWFEEFRRYWDGVVEGRPLTVVDFHHLRFAYRTRSHSDASTTLEWGATERHLANWQDPRYFSQLFEFVYNEALHPGDEWGLLLPLLRRGNRVLEYGCSNAPMYRAWRTYGSHVPARWMLADIPGFAFHYARDALACDAEVEFHVISDLADPLRGVEGEFDLVIAQEVFEHLDHPRAIAEYLLARIRRGGHLWFNFPTTSGTGLDTPAAQEERIPALRYLADHLDVVYGELRVDERPLGTCVGRKR